MKKRVLMIGFVLVLLLVSACEPEEPEELTEEEQITEWLNSGPTVQFDDQEIPVEEIEITEEFTHVIIYDSEGNILAIVSIEELMGLIEENKPVVRSRSRSSRGSGPGAPTTIIIDGRTIQISEITKLPDTLIDTQFKITDIEEKTGQASATAQVEAFTLMVNDWFKIRDYPVTVPAGQTHKLIETISDFETALNPQGLIVDIPVGGSRDVYFFVLNKVFEVTVFNLQSAPPPPPPAPVIVPIPTPPPICSIDNQWNGDESDTDCGGSLCSSCANTLSCWENSDCASNNCVGTSSLPITYQGTAYNNYNSIRLLAGDTGIIQFQGTCQ